MIEDKLSKIGRLLLMIGLLCLSALMGGFMLVSKIDFLLDKGIDLTSSEMLHRLEETEEVLVKGSRLSFDVDRNLYIKNQKVGSVHLKTESWFQQNIYLFTVGGEVVGHSIFVPDQALTKCLDYENHVLGYVTEKDHQYLFYSNNLDLIAMSEKEDEGSSTTLIKTLSGKQLYSITYRYDFWRNEQSFLIKVYEESELSLVMVVWMIYFMEVDQEQ